MWMDDDLMCVFESHKACSERRGSSHSACSQLSAAQQSSSEDDFSHIFVFFHLQNSSCAEINILENKRWVLGEHTQTFTLILQFGNEVVIFLQSCVICISSSSELILNFHRILLKLETVTVKVWFSSPGFEITAFPSSNLYSNKWRFVQVKSWKNKSLWISNESTKISNKIKKIVHKVFCWISLGYRIPVYVFFPTLVVFHSESGGIIWLD